LPVREFSIVPPDEGIEPERFEPVERLERALMPSGIVCNGTPSIPQPLPDDVDLVCGTGRLRVVADVFSSDFRAVRVVGDELAFDGDSAEACPSPERPTTSRRRGSIAG
jgi:hypothetical protein